MTEKNEPSESLKMARALAAKLRRELPAKFTLQSRLSLNGEKLFPDLHFKADPNVAGLFRAKIDRDIVTGKRQREGKIVIHHPGDGNGYGNGHGNGETGQE